jgi:hypothetical protein
MGSLVYARDLRREVDADRLRVAGMLCLEMVGYFRTEANSQPYPPELPRWLTWPLPSRGDFLALVADAGSARFTYRLRRKIGMAQPGSLPKVPIWSLAIPFSWTGGAHSLSDHWSFRQCGFSATMLTDTAFVRNPHYHGLDDTHDTLDYQRMGRVTLRLARALTRF